MGSQSYSFPKGFIWGAATSSYQIEGACNADGKGKSIWDIFSHVPGNVENGGTGDIACDHYNLWPKDVALMKEIGLKAYRFSISWPRILPDGYGKVNKKGIDFYNRLVDGLLEAGIIPFATLYHWDLPVRLEEKGGWTSRSTAEAFSEYAETISRYLGDRVKYWITHNEPSVTAYLGYQTGEHAPGKKDFASALRVAHHLLLSHGLSIPVLRRNAKNAEIGMTLCLIPSTPASSRSDDIKAATSFDGYMNRWFLDPLYGRQYPADKIEEYKEDGYFPEEKDSFIKPGDFDVISCPTDFLGVNYYLRGVMRAWRIQGKKESSISFYYREPEYETTNMGWEIYPEGLYDLLNRVHADYKPKKIIITENGASYNTGPNASGQVPDKTRINFLQNHFIAAHKAIQNNIPLAGYFVWSLMDNFEWAKGYKQRFGLIWIDYETKKRILKDSALWYKEVIAKNTLTVSS